MLSKSNHDTRELVMHGNPIPFTESRTIKTDSGRSAILYKNTVMARLAVVSAITPAVAGAGVAGANTGNGTCTVASVIGLDAQGRRVVPKVGNWRVGLTAALVAKLTDPDGVDVVTGIALTDGGATVIRYAGLVCTVTDGATPFAAGDGFYLPVVADGDFIPLDLDNVLGGAYPAGIYIGSNIASAAIVAGDVTDCYMLESGAVIDENKLVFENSVTKASIIPELGISVEKFFEKSGIIFRAGTVAFAAQRA